jgi:hypothetical protein
VHSNPDARERHAVRLGVAGAVLAFLALTTVQAVAIRPYLPPDELYHVGYAATVLDGRLPTLTTPLPTDRVPLAPDDGRPRRVYVANHPPLFYALTALPLGLGEWFEAPRAGFLAARLLSASLAAVGLVMVAVLALALVPGRPRVAVGAVWLVALLPSLPHVSAFVYNDGLGFLAATATLAAAVVVVRRGPTLPRLAWLTGAAATAALTRAPGLALVVLAAAAAAAGVLLHGRQAPARRALYATAAGAAVGGVAGGAAIGFYLRNRSLYGSLTGAAYNQELFRFKPQDNTLDLLASPGYALRLYDGLWAWTRFNLPGCRPRRRWSPSPGWSGCSSWPGWRWPPSAVSGPTRRPAPGRRWWPPGGSPWSGWPGCTRWSSPTTATAATSIPATCSRGWPCWR